MKRQEWTPSRHQYLCSEHFTEDSFDLRWGIRYLKHTAIPTIFPYICDVSYFLYLLSCVLVCLCNIESLERVVCTFPKRQSPQIKHHTL